MFCEIAAYMGEISYNAHLFLPLSFCISGAIRQNDAILLEYFLDRKANFSLSLDSLAEPDPVTCAIIANKPKFLALVLANSGSIKTVANIEDQQDRTQIWQVINNFLIAQTTVRYSAEAYYAGYLKFPRSFMGAYYGVEFLKAWIAGNTAREGTTDSLATFVLTSELDNALAYQTTLDSGLVDELLTKSKNKANPNRYVEDCLIHVQPQVLKQLLKLYPIQISESLINRSQLCVIVAKPCIIDAEFVAKVQEMYDFLTEFCATHLCPDTAYIYYRVLLQIILNKVQAESMQTFLRSYNLFKHDFEQVSINLSVSVCNSNFLHNYVNKDTLLNHDLKLIPSNIFHDPYGTVKLMRVKLSNLHHHCWCQGKLVELLDSSAYPIAGLCLHPGKTIPDPLTYVMDNIIFDDSNNEYTVERAKFINLFIKNGKTKICGPPFLEPIQIYNKKDVIYVLYHGYPELAMFMQSRNLNYEFMCTNFTSIATYKTLVQSGAVDASEDDMDKLTKKAEREKALLAKLI